jgi:hypothetical protein
MVRPDALTGGGSDIWNNSDEFTYAFKTVNGDATIVAKVTNIGAGTNTWAKGGVMIRDGLDGGSVHAMMVMTANSDGTAVPGASPGLPSAKHNSGACIQPMQAPAVCGPAVMSE